MVFQKLILFKKGSDVNGFRMEYHLEGDQKKGINGTIVLLSLDESEQKTFQFKEGALTPSGGRKRELGGTLPEAICRAFRNYQMQLTWTITSSPFTIFFSVDASDPNAGDAPGSLYGVADPIDDLIQAIEDFLVEVFGRGLSPRDRAFLKTLSLSQVYDFFIATAAAQDMTQALFYNQGGLSGDGNFANAFKHAYWAFRLASSWGSRELASTFLNGHELGHTGCLTRMDNANNLIGLDLYTYGGADVSSITNVLLGMYLWVVGGNDCITLQGR